MSKRFVTIFPIAENSHLIKDLGQIPHFMNKLFGYNAEIVCYQNDPEYFHAQGEVNGIVMRFLKNKGKKHFWEKAVVEFLEKEAKLIDVLNLYHFNKDTLKYGVLYKKLNPGGKLYVKMDAYNDHLQSRKKYSVKPLKKWYFKRLEKQFLQAVNLMSIENTAGLELMKEHYPELRGRIIYLPNGINESFLKNHFPNTKKFEEKAPTILTVGRIGLAVKNNEMLLRVIPLLDLKGWKVKFVGPIHSTFQAKIDAFYSTHPKLKPVVEFTGSISDRKALYSYYDDAKIFCLTSPFESFGMAFVEAQYFGNYILGTTGMSAFEDLSNTFQFGSQCEVNDDKNYAKLIQQLIDDESKLASTCEQIKEQTKAQFTWESIVTNLNAALYE